ncbi:MAG TPA: ABC transporter permease [Dongiaceae bacterium]|jgi:spermidine/putrescine transport system permease protein
MSEAVIAGSLPNTDMTVEQRVNAAQAAAERASRRTRWSLIAPALIVIGVLGIAPLFIILIYSFLTPGAYGGVVWQFSTDAYVQFILEKDLFDESYHFTTAYFQIYARSIGLAAFTTVGSLILGFPTAYFMATRPAHQRNFWLFLITLPFWSNLLIRTFAMFVLMRDDGIVNNVLLEIGILNKPFEIMFTDTAIGIALLYSFLPFMVLPIYASLEKLDFRYVEAAYDLYATRWKVLWRVIIPLSKPGIVAGCLLVFIPALGAYVTPLLVGGGKSLMIGNLIALQFSGSRNWPFGSAASLILMALVLAALYIYVRYGTRKSGFAHG